jgi:cytochrome c oxidase cbb3-type subunit 4
MQGTYATLAGFAQTWGLAYFVIVFASVVAWTLWPSRRHRFEQAARMPLQED